MNEGTIAGATLHNSYRKSTCPGVIVELSPGGHSNTSVVHMSE